MRFGSCCWECVYKFQCVWVCPWCGPGVSINPCDDSEKCDWNIRCGRFRADRVNHRVRKKRIGRRQYPLCFCTGKWVESKRFGMQYICPECRKIVGRRMR